jgi:hypothetical protein
MEALQTSMHDKSSAICGSLMDKKRTLILEVALEAGQLRH